MSKIRGAVAVVAIAILTSAGCAAESPSVTAPSHAAPSATPSSVALVEPLSAFDIECSDVIPDAEIQALVGDHGSVRAALSPSSRYAGTSGVAVLADGALSCEWPSEGSGLNIARLSVIAVPDAEDFFARARPSLMARPAAYMPAYISFDYFDDTLVECLDYYVDAVGYVCRWQVLVDDIWLSIELGGVPSTDYYIPVPREDANTGVKPIEAIVEGSASLDLVTSIVDSVVNAPRVDIEHRSAELPECSALVDVASIQPLSTEQIAPVGDEEPLESMEAPFPALLPDYSMERLGFRDCVVYTATSWGVQFTVTPALNWLFQAPFAPPSGDLEHVDGLGVVYTDCHSGLDGPVCNMTVAGANATVSMVMYDSQNPEIPLAVARSVLAALQG